MQDGISATLLAQQEALLSDLSGAGRLLVAFSGGVDSSYLAWAARRALGRDALAVTAVSPSYPAAHREMAERIAREFDIAHRFVETHEMDQVSYRRNAPDRCYHCKTELFVRMENLLEELGFDALAYGINLDDQSDHRPGHRAAAEHRVLSPLMEAGLDKESIRLLSREAGLPCWDLPASACLASRLPYGTEVTAQRLKQVEEGEERLRGLGFRQVRLRHHGDVARVEIDPEEIRGGLSTQKMQAISAAIKPLGFRWVCIDVDGYRMGSLNDALLNPSTPSASLTIEPS